MKIPGRDNFTLTLNLLSEKWGYKQIIREREKIQTMATESILVVACTALGDAILCTPLLRKLRQSFPEARIGFLIKEPFYNLFEIHAYNIKVHPYTKKYHNEDELISSLKEQNYHVALLANANDPDVVPLLYRSGIRAFLRRPTRDTAYRDWMANKEQLSRPYDEDYATGHAIIQNLKMVEWMTQRVSTECDYPSEVFFSSQDVKSVASLLPAGKEIIGIHPGASKDFKRWPISYFRELIRMLYTPTRHFIITGSKQESDLTNQILDGESPHITALSGKVTLRELAAAMKQFKVFISGDTGPYHLAMAVGCPTVTWFAPTDKGSDIEAVGPLFNQKNHRVLRPEAYSQNMNTIHPENVCRCVQEILNQ